MVEMHKHACRMCIFSRLLFHFAILYFAIGYSYLFSAQSYIFFVVFRIKSFAYSFHICQIRSGFNFFFQINKSFFFAGCIFSITFIICVGFIFLCWVYFLCQVYFLYFFLYFFLCWPRFLLLCVARLVFMLGLFLCCVFFLCFVSFYFDKFTFLCWVSLFVCWVNFCFKFFFALA